MSPSPRAVAALSVIALAALVVPPALAILAAVALAVAVVVDALAVRPAPRLDRELPAVLSRGVPAALRVVPAGERPGRLRLRQAATPDLAVEDPEADGVLEARVVPRRRGRHALPATATRGDGPLGLGRWHHRAGEPAHVAVFPDLPAARRLALGVRQGGLRASGRHRRGPLGLGTEFESVRDYLPDDDVRQVNWRATARLGRPMSNQFRVEQDRDVLCVVDAGRLMAAPLADRTRLDAALDAVTAVALVADELGDRCGAVAFDAEIRARVKPKRGGGDAVVRALFDLEPRPVDSDFELAFRAVGGAKRAFMLVLTDLLEEAGAGPLVAAVPVLARRHAVAVASVRDPDLDALVTTPPRGEGDLYAMAVAVDVLDARQRAIKLVERAGAQVVEAGPAALAAACVRAYLSAKARARL
jgi:uncharacterized protein (DUF58 family)